MKYFKISKKKIQDEEKPNILFLMLTSCSKLIRFKSDVERRIGIKAVSMPV
jgi:hypothetical protein